MVLLIILGILIGIIVLIMMIPVGADLRFEDEVIRVSLRAAGINLQVIPRKKKEPRPEKPKEEKKKEPKPEKQKSGEKRKRRSLPFNSDEILELLQTVLKGFGRFGKKVRVERFVLHWIAADRDPYRVARCFSIVNAGLSQLAPVCEERFHCRDSSVWTDLDFTREDMFFEFGLTMTIRIGQIVGTGITIAFGALKILLRSRKRAKREAKEQAAALEQWLREHPEDAERYAEQQRLEAEKKAAEEAAKKAVPEATAEASKDAIQGAEQTDAAKNVNASD